MSTLTQNLFDNLAPGNLIKSIQAETIYKVISLEEALLLDTKNETGFIKECYEEGNKLITYYPNRKVQPVFILHSSYFESHCIVLEKEEEKSTIKFILGKED